MALDLTFPMALVSSNSDHRRPRYGENGDDGAMGGELPWLLLFK